MAVRQGSRSMLCSDHRARTGKAIVNIKDRVGIGETLGKNVFIG